MPTEVNDNGELINPVVEYGNLRSEAMSEFISKRLGFLSRWAMLFFIIILILLLYGTWLIHYPDVIKSKATLTATNAPKELIVRQEGRLIRLFVNNSDSVSEGSVLGYIESNANHEQVIKLKNYLDNTVADIQKDNTQNIVSRFSVNFNSLGELQEGYQRFISAYQLFTDYLQNGFYLKKKKILVEDMALLQKNYAIVQKQKDLLLKDLTLSEETYKANESLLKDKVISKQDDRIEQSKLLNKQLSIPQIDASLVNNETLKREKQKEITDLEHSISLQKVIFQQAAQTLQSLINDWLKKYVLLAPISGKISFLIPLQENQFLKAGKSVAFVNPPNTKFYAEVMLHQYNFGKVDTGQQVQLRFDAYPYQEFGFVNGKLKYISDFATDSGFIAHIELLNGLETSHYKTLHYRDGLTAEAQIITQDMRLIERFYYNIISSIKR